MVCESMAEDQSASSLSNTAKSIHPNEQFTSADEYAPKIRKPYTITKQRERWTEDEHKKFLEALKLYGRAWRRIEEHVGTKTAVQIRSHAQKFFSKVVRESSSDGAEVKPIEIPPPRPKRKPTHPYPRKLSVLGKTGVCRARSTSPNSSGSDQDNQSPTSVLSAGGSNTFALGDSSSPNVESSPISSDNGIKPGRSSQFEADPSPGENAPSPLAEENDSSSPVKLESCSEEKGFAKESSTEAASTQSLKLFGKTVLVTDSHRPSSPINGGTCKQLLPDDDDNGVQILPQNMLPMHALPCGAPVYYMNFLDENSDSTLMSSSATPLWSLYGGLSYPFMQLNSPLVPTNQGGLNKESKEKVQNEGGSLTGSNSDAESVGVKEDESKKPFLFRQSERSAFTKQCRGNNNKDKCIKGFVPYKRCLAERNSHSHSSVVTGEEREEQRIRLCL